MKLLLIDSRIPEQNSINLDSALQQDVQYISYSYENDTYDSILSQIHDFNEESYDSIGFVFGGNDSMLTFGTEDDFHGFLGQLKSFSPNFDFLGDSILKYLVPSMEGVTMTKSHTPSSSKNLSSPASLYFSAPISLSGSGPLKNPNIKSNNLNIVDVQYQKGGNAYIWGSNGNGGTFVYNQTAYGQIPDITGIKAVYANDGAFAALLEDGSVYIWGNPGYGGSNIFNDATKYGYLMVDGVKLTGVKTIRYTYRAFAAILEDGRVCIWGNPFLGGSIEFGVANPPTIISDLNNVKAIYAAGLAFAALKNDNTVYVWGHPFLGGATTFGGSPGLIPNLNTVKNIYGADIAFAALLDNGTVYVWGEPTSGGAISYNGVQGVIPALDNVVNITNTLTGFAALTSDKKVFIWGNLDVGGSLVRTPATGYIYILYNISQVYSNNYAFAAVNNYGQVYVWGDSVAGGSPVWNNTGNWVPGFIPELTNVNRIYATETAFAATTTKGRTFIWGDPNAGGAAVYGNISTAGYLPAAYNAVNITGTYAAFAAQLKNGTTFSWGNSGTNTAIVNPNQETLNDVVFIQGTADIAFAALRKNETVTPWGRLTSGGDEAQTSDLTNVVNVYASGAAFTALTGASDPKNINATVDNSPKTLAFIALGLAVLLLIFVIFFMNIPYAINIYMIAVIAIIILMVLALVLIN